VVFQIFLYDDNNSEIEFFFVQRPLLGTGASGGKGGWQICEKHFLKISRYTKYPILLSFLTAKTMHKKLYQRKSKILKRWILYIFTHMYILYMDFLGILFVNLGIRRIQLYLLVCHNYFRELLYLVRILNMSTQCACQRY